MIIKINPEIIPYDNLIRKLCLTPYYGHSRGCPNYCKKQGCPPIKLINNFFDFNKDIFVVYTKFPVGEFAERMRKAHPEWTEFNYPDQPKKSRKFVDEVINELATKHSWPKEYFPEPKLQNWTSAREWYNPRRWQGTARKDHKLELQSFLEQYPDLIIDSSPEARGVNLTGLMYELGIKLNWQWPPIHNIKNTSYLISLAGYKK
jgi:hypothetical protein